MSFQKKASEAEIPSKGELDRIISLESPRRVPKNKVFNKYADYISFIKILEYFDTRVGFFENIYRLKDYLGLSDDTKNELVKRVLGAEKSNELMGLLNVFLNIYLKKVTWKVFRKRFYLPKSLTLFLCSGQNQILELTKQLSYLKRVFRPL